jgi:hypothetical protein
MEALGAKLNLSAGMAFTALIISASMRLRSELMDFAGARMVPAAGAEFPPLIGICAVAASELAPNTKQNAIVPARMKHLVEMESLGNGLILAEPSESSSVV